MLSSESSEDPEDSEHPEDSESPEDHPLNIRLDLYAIDLRKSPNLPQAEGYNPVAAKRGYTPTVVQQTGGIQTTGQQVLYTTRKAQNVDTHADWDSSWSLSLIHI